MYTIEVKQFLDELREEWKSMWRDRVDDKVRAEGIAGKDYSRLFVDKGTVIIATRKFRILDFHDIIEQHKDVIGPEAVPPSPSMGGWGKFIKTTLQPRNTARHRRHMPSKLKETNEQQQKKGGRGWLHFNAK